MKCPFCGESLSHVSSIPTETGPVNPLWYQGPASRWNLLGIQVIFLFWLIFSILLIVFPFFLPKLEKMLGLNLKAIPVSSLTSVLITSGLILMLTALLYFLFHWLRFKSRIYRISGDSIEIRSGIFSKTIQRMEWKEVQDIVLCQDGWQWFLGIGTLIVLSSQNSVNPLEIPSLPRVRKILHEMKSFLNNRNRAPAEKIKLDPQNP
ncbi:MAG: PH domain-containing protein [Candidatus Aureabacteria bacterium]|nr:PH domain-containing protein [Candidatus Auribacterota bacterium]